MAYTTLEDCINDLEKNSHLIRIKEEVDPHLEMAAIHLRVHEAEGPALLFENVKGSKFRAASNIFGTMERSRFIFRKRFGPIQQIISLRNNPQAIFKHPFRAAKNSVNALSSLPKKINTSHVIRNEIKITDLPLIRHWPKDGGAFITLPQVYTEDITKPGVHRSNLGMYRIQLTGNNYILNEEAGLHYQIHRGIGVHQTKANAKGLPLKVSIFVGGPPAHTLAAVMPLPEGMSELMFAGLLGGRRFRYFYKDGFCISADADFIITGEVFPGENKPEGPFGDHLGYYSLRHDFPVMHIRKLYAKNKAIWPFTVVGRPPQEDTAFGNLIHELTGSALAKEIPGLQQVNAVDAAGVHPLLLATGSERYTPYNKTKQPAEILTIANHILGTGQLSLAKFLFITADDERRLSPQNIPAFFDFVLKRINLKRDIHFYTNTTIDTLDYSGTGLNQGSKIVFAAYGDVLRELCTSIPFEFSQLQNFENAQLALPGIVCLQTKKFTDYTNAETEMQQLNEQLCNTATALQQTPFIIVCDDASFMANSLHNFLWATFTRCNPAYDIYGINSFYSHKHWGCDAVVLDARSKPHHAPVLEKDTVVEKNIERVFNKGGSLYKALK
ncbi:UbiD family decarboxylase [Parafilimonas sp.]|uniref:UbiD family decarboxylase n=1 Tax=Parafilimonas sp. TaxID=1969739 RepID=UPI0039E44DD1